MQTNFRQFFIAIAVCAAVLVGAFALITAFLPENDYANADMAAANNISSPAYNQIAGQGEAINSITHAQDSNFQPSLFDVANSLLSAGIGTLTTIWQSSATVKSLFENIGDLFNLPTWFVGMFVIIITTVVAFLFIDFWRRWYT